MDLTPSPQEAAFREDLRSWLDANVPEPFEADPRTDDAERVSYLRAWQRKLAEGGWLGITWPTEYGGRGLSAVEQAIFVEELARANAPPIIGMLGIAIIGPTIALLGSEEQKQRHLGRILLCEEIWAAGYSEPNAGSDLGALATRAVLDGDHFIVNGQKIWTSYAHVSDWIQLLVRTDPDLDKFRGVTCLLVDMKSEGVAVRPLRQMTGESEFNEVFFTDVRVPVSAVLGEVNGGWNVAVASLMYERANLGGNFLVQLIQFLDSIVAAVRERGLGDDPLVRQKIGQAHAELETYRVTLTRAMSKIGKGEMPGAEASILKVFWSELNQRMTRWAMEILGPHGQLTEGDLAPFSYMYLRSRGNTIEAGTSEVMRNTIAYRVLGLPKSF
jgi:alkylation response protein AidB-like acyl-CoA dehydrogenase